VNCSLANVKPNEVNPDSNHINTDKTNLVLFSLKGRQIQSDKSWDVQSIEAFKDLIQFRESVSSVWAKQENCVLQATKIVFQTNFFSGQLVWLQEILTL